MEISSAKTEVAIIIPKYIKYKFLLFGVRFLSKENTGKVIFRAVISLIPPSG